MSKTELLELRLKNSMGTQTEVVPKISYNELKKCRLLARITAQLETNDHDNYCSDEDCKYVKKVVKVSTKVPDEYEDAKIGIINKKKEYAWTKHLPVPEIQVTGSNYLLDACKFKCVEGGVGQHQYRYKIKKVEIIENSKYVSKKVKVNKNGYVILGEHLDPYEYCWTDAHGYAKTLEEARAIAEDAILVGRTKTYFDRKWESGCRQFDEGSYCRARIIDLDTMDMVDDEYCSNGNGKVKKEKNEKEEESEAVKLFLKTLERK